MENVMFTFLPMILMFVIYIPLLALTIYAVILFIKLSNRGIKALDIYIDEKNKQDKYI